MAPRRHHPGPMLDNLSRRADLLGERRRVDDDDLELVLLDDLELRIARIRRRTTTSPSPNAAACAGSSRTRPTSGPSCSRGRLLPHRARRLVRAAGLARGRARRVADPGPLARAATTRAGRGASCGITPRRRPATAANDARLLPYGVRVQPSPTCTSPVTASCGCSPPGRRTPTARATATAHVAGHGPGRLDEHLRRRHRDLQQRGRRAVPPGAVDAAFTRRSTVCRHLGLDPSDVIQHADYAPDRKIDPATARRCRAGGDPTRSPRSAPGSSATCTTNATAAPSPRSRTRARAATTGGRHADVHRPGPRRPRQLRHRRRPVAPRMDRAPSGTTSCAR